MSWFKYDPGVWIWRRLHPDAYIEIRVDRDEFESKSIDGGAKYYFKTEEWNGYCNGETSRLLVEMAK